MGHGLTAEGWVGQLGPRTQGGKLGQTERLWDMGVWTYSRGMGRPAGC